MSTYKKRVVVEYSWNHDGKIGDDLKKILDEEAADHIEKMTPQGFIEGQLVYENDTETILGYWNVSETAVYKHRPKQKKTNAESTDQK